TLYAFSTENWKRPRKEVDFLMKLPNEFLHTYLPELIENNVKINIIGESHALPSHTKEAIKYAKEQTKHYYLLLLYFSLKYGIRYEIMQIIKQIIDNIDEQVITCDAIDENIFSKYLYTNVLSDPDLLIRTSGEKRLSNFLLCQLAYAEF